MGPDALMKQKIKQVTRIALEGPDSWAPLPDASSAALPEGADLKELAD
ncbi:hypothetical protein HaLaN_27298, partial [Haematococcus lacustris]